MSTKVKIGEIFDFINGYAFSKEDWSASGYKIIRIQNLTNEVSGYNNTMRLPNEKYLVKKGDILLSWSGTLGVFKWKEENALLNQHIYKVVPNESKITASFSYYLLYDLLLKIKHRMRGSAFMHLTKHDLIQQEVSVPDLEIQNRIVATLDKVQSLIDKRKRTIGLLDELVRATFLDMFGNPILNEKNYNISRLKNLGDWQSGGTPKRSMPEFFEGDIPWITSGELNTIFISDSKEKITESALQLSFAKKIEKGSLLVGMYDTAALKLSITTVEASCNQAIAFSKLDEKKCSTIYIYYAIQLLKQKYLDKRKGARQRNLNIDIIKNIEVPLPRIEDQQKFEEIFRKILSRNSKLINSENGLLSLFQSILQDVFNEKEVISEEDLFEDLVKTFAKDDYLKDSKRIGYLINGLRQNRFKDYEAYEAAQKMAFILLEEGRIRQEYLKNKRIIELSA